MHLHIHMKSCKCLRVYESVIERDFGREYEYKYRFL